MRIAKLKNAGISPEEIQELQKSYVGIKGENEMSGVQKETKLIMRTVSMLPDPAAGSFSVYEVDAYISSFLSAGWQILDAGYIGKAEDNKGWAFYWVLVQ
jgi:hypothetical protein